MSQQLQRTHTLDNKVLLVTGGTGTFGNAVVRRFLNSHIKEIRIFSRDEKKQEDLRAEICDPKLKFQIGDVREYDSLCSAMVGVDYVFHAAALKQVPSCEFYPLEALRTNSLGAENVLRAAQERAVEKVIVLSTDKAVYPINAMGLSKAMMEKLMVARSRIATTTGTTMSGTRYGNVMASRGSVIPLFIKQIVEGLPITITDPEMTRFMMTIDEAVDLVLYAYERGRPGDIFVKKAPAATIGMLAEALQEIFEQRTTINIIGTRHGEKLYETLLTREEMVRAEDQEGYFRIPSDNRDLNYSLYFSEGEEKVSSAEDYHSHNTARLDKAALIELLLSLEFVQHSLTAWKAEHPRRGKNIGSQGRHTTIIETGDPISSREVPDQQEYDNKSPSPRTPLEIL